MEPPYDENYPDVPTLRRQEISIDQALTAVGEFGYGQRLQLCVAGLGWVAASLQTLLVVFAALSPATLHNFACLKEDEACLGELAKPRPDICGLVPGTWEWTRRGASLASEFDLVCGLEWVLQLVNACFFGGVLVGCAVFQLASGRFGRRRLMYTGAVLSGAAGLMCCTAPSLWLYILFRTLTGFAVGGLGLSAFVLATDPIGPAWRPLGALLLQAFFSAGACMACLLAWVAPGWRLLSVLCTLPSLAFLATWPYVHESPSFLLLRGRKGEATAVLAALALANRTRPPELPLADPTAFLANPQARFRDMLANNKLRQRLLLSGGAWFAAGLAYYGALLVCEGLSGWQRSGEGSVYGTVLTYFSYEIPGIAAAGLSAERLGRKCTLVAGFLQAGGCLVAAAAVGGGFAQRALAVASRFGLAGAYATLFLLSSELYPAVVRAQGLATGNYCARAGALLAPALVALTGHVRLRGGAGGWAGEVAVPLVATGGVCLAAAALGLALPETLGNPAPETIQELSGAGMRRMKSWTIALRQMFRSRSRQSRGEEESTVVLRTA